MEMNIRTKISIHAVCTCGNPLDIAYHKKWYGRYAIGVNPCEKCSEKTGFNLTWGGIYDTLSDKWKTLWRGIDGE